MAHPYTHAETVKPSKPSKTGVAPCSCVAPPPLDTCCELICFERPRYFCGHLLTDEDLSKEQRYVIEKHKLYHRALHGYGVVCGLRLTCDHHCPGHILIDEGYAIDDCGHDLVVCEPRRFNVIGWLREHGHLQEPAQPDPCETPEKEPECTIRQCWHVMICYTEEESDFTTPFVAGCRPKLTECEPTRVHESVRFELVDKLPKQPRLLDYLKKPLECFKLFTEGKFNETLKSSVVSTVFDGGGDLSREDVCEVICQLKHWLLVYLAKHPDHYNCTVKDEIDAITCPDDGDYKETICAIIEIAWRHVISCALGELIPVCREPCKATCVVLGTVEIENGELVRVCNCPRNYVWSAAHFFEVLIAWLAGLFACEKEGEEVCCAELDLPCESLAALLGIRGTQAKSLSQTAGSVRSDFAKIRPEAVVRQILRRVPVASVQTAMSELGVEISKESVMGIVQVFQAFGLADIGEPRVVSAVQKDVATLKQQVANLEATIAEMAKAKIPAKRRPPTEQE